MKRFAEDVKPIHRLGDKKPHHAGDLRPRVIVSAGIDTNRPNNDG